MINKPGTIHQYIYHSQHHPHLDVRTTLDSRQPYATHLHDCLSLGIVTQGRTLLTFPDGNRVLQEGEGVLIAPEQAHSCNPVDGQPRSYHMFYIDRSWALRVIGAPAHATISIQDPVIQDPSVIDMLLRLAECIPADRALPEADALLRREITRRASAANHPFRLWQVCADTRSVGTAAREAGLVRESYIRRVKRQAGMTPGAYRQCLRLARARQLLREGTSLAAAAAASGFADQSHLHRMCVKYLAATPKQLKPR